MAETRDPKNMPNDALQAALEVALTTQLERIGSSDDFFVRMRGKLGVVGKGDTAKDYADFFIDTRSGKAFLKKDAFAAYYGRHSNEEFNPRCAIRLSTPLNVHRGSCEAAHAVINLFRWTLERHEANLPKNEKRLLRFDPQESSTLIGASSWEDLVGGLNRVLDADLQIDTKLLGRGK